MKVLFITHHYLNLKGGGAFASRAIINAFSQVSENMTLLYPSKSGDKRPEIDAMVETIPVLFRKPLFVKLLLIYCGRIHRYYKIGKQYLTNSNKYDTVVFDNSITSHKLLRIAISRGLRVITIHHNCQYDITKDNTPWYTRIPMLFWVGRAEKESVRTSHLNLTLTESDKKRLLEKYSKTAIMAVLGIFETEPSEVPLIEKNEKRGYRYIITGNLSVKQTIDSLYYWLKNYYPLLVKQDENSELIIAGKDPQRELYEICKGKRIRIIASPENMSLLLKESDYYLCPIWQGSGIKLRIMDGLKFGIPVLTHVKSIRGYESFLGKGVYTYKDTTSFMQQIDLLKESVYDRQQIYNEYAKIFSFDSGLARLKSILVDNGIIMI